MVEDTSQFSKQFMKNYYEGNDVQYIENVYNLYNDRPFLPQGMKI